MPEPVVYAECWACGDRRYLDDHHTPAHLEGEGWVNPDDAPGEWMCVRCLSLRVDDHDPDAGRGE